MSRGHSCLRSLVEITRTDSTSTLISAIMLQRVCRRQSVEDIDGWEKAFCQPVIATLRLS